MAAAVSCTEPREAPGGREEKVWAVKLGMVYLRGELRWAPVHKGCCLGRNGWVMRKVPAVLWVRGVQDVCFGWARFCFGCHERRVCFVGGDGDGGRKEVRVSQVNL